VGYSACHHFFVVSQRVLDLSERAASVVSG
jgi:hypothetical protein